MRVGADGDFHARGSREAGVFGREVKPVGTGINLKAAAVFSRVLDNPLYIDLVAWTAQQQPAGGVAENRKVAVVHRAHDPLRLRRLVQPEARVDGANSIVELAQQVVGIIELAIGE